MSRLPQMHHVVYAVAPDRLDAAAAFFTELGSSNWPNWGFG